MSAGRLALLVIAATALVMGGAGPAGAHEPVRLDGSDTSPDRGPLLVDGTVSFAVYSATAAKDARRGFRVGFASGQSLRVQELITDRAPANALAPSALPVVTLVSPSGRRITLRPNERTPFFERHSGTRYLYISRYTGVAEKGTYRVSVRSRTNSPVTAVIAVGYREVPGQVRS